jgi:peroxiredoxin
MRNKLLLALLAILVVSCGSKDTKEVFTVHGNIQGIKASMVYLDEVPMATMQRIPIDSVVPDKNGSFQLKAKAAEQSVYNVRIAGQDYPAASLINDGNEVTLSLFYNPKQTQFPDRYEVKGSIASTKLREYMLEFNNELQKVFVLRQQTDSLLKLPVAADSLVSIEEGKLAQKRKALRTLTDKFTQDTQHPALTMMILGYYQSTAGNPSFGLQGYSDEEVSAIVNKLSEAHSNHQGLAALKSIISVKSPVASPSTMVGQTAPEFSLPDYKGQMISLSSYRGKYVLVDFWASWCAPCRQENPNVVEAFAKFKNRNFTILGVSLDEQDGKEAWTKAVMQDQLTWTQVSDLKGWGSEVVSLYGIQGIPFNVLVDPQGKIIAESLRGPQLAAKLDEVLPR